MKKISIKKTIKNDLRTLTKRFLCVKLFTRCSAKIFSLGVFNDRLRSSLAVLSSSLSFSFSSSSSSSLMLVVKRELISLS
jgi:hypothetical protein